MLYSVRHPEIAAEEKLKKNGLYDKIEPFRQSDNVAERKGNRTAGIRCTSCPIMMNYLHLSYIVTVASLGSLTKASRKLMVAQPNLSRIIQSMEETIGITIFSRSSRGVTLTPDGERFIRKAQQILSEIDSLEKMFTGTPAEQQSFSVSVPEAAYIADAFARFSSVIADAPAEFICRVTTAAEAIRDVLEERCHLSIISFMQQDEPHYRILLEEKHLTREVIADYLCPVLVSRKSPLAEFNLLSYSELRPFIEITSGTASLAPLSPAEMPKESPAGLTGRQILVTDRAARYDVLQQNPETYLWTSPVPPQLLDRYQLAQIPCTDPVRHGRDVLIYRAGYILSDLDKRFITEIIQSRRKAMPS